MEEKKSKKGFSESMDRLYEKLGNFSKNARIGMAVGLIVVIVGGLDYLVFRDKRARIETLDAELTKVEQERDEAKRRADKLPYYKKEIEKVAAQFEIAKRALPESEEIPSLLTNISRSGQDEGLEFVLFQPQKEEASTFYSEIPIQMRIKGRYHDMALFLYKISRLDRIVNISNLNLVSKAITRVAKPDNSDPDDLFIECKAVTYKFIEVPKVTKPDEKKK